MRYEVVYCSSLTVFLYMANIGKITRDQQPVPFTFPRLTVISLLISTCKCSTAQHLVA